MSPIRMMWKHFIYFSVIVFVTFVLLVFFTSRKIKSHHIQTLETALQNQAELLKGTVEELMVSGSAEEIDHLVKELGQKIDERITVVRSDGVVLGDSKENPSQMENHAFREEIQQALHGEVGKTIRYSTTVKEEMLYVAMPIEDKGEIIGVIRISVGLKSIKENVEVINRQIVYSAIALMVLALFASFLFSRALTKPIKDMAITARKIKDGDFKARAFVKSKNELGELADALNEMARELESSFSNLDSEREELKGIVSAMVEGLVVLDRQGKIVLANQGFMEIVGIFSLSSIIGKRYWEVLQSAGLNELVKTVSEKGKPESREIVMREKIYWGSGILVSGEHGEKIIVVLHDITEIKRLEKIKADFIANVSHELRTPLTSIMGFVETLQDGTLDEPGQSARFLSIVSRHVDRMAKIVSDLLQLSQIESKEFELKMELFPIKELMEEVVLSLKRSLDQKSQSIEISLESEGMQVEGDRYRVNQALTNLVENAIRYTPPKGKIKIEARSKGEWVEVAVIDNGIGISREDLSRVFERFYTVDKGRSRELGGTGLGLSIVKHIIEAHGVKVYVESEVGKGSKFSFTLKKA